MEKHYGYNGIVKTRVILVEENGSTIVQTNSREIIEKVQSIVQRDGEKIEILKSPIALEHIIKLCEVNLARGNNIIRQCITQVSTSVNIDIYEFSFAGNSPHCVTPGVYTTYLW